MKQRTAWIAAARWMNALLGLAAGATAVVLLGAFAGAANAQTGGPYDLTWNTLDGGGATFSTGGSYSLGGTIGQFDPGTLIGGAYVVRGGFWRGGVTGAATGVGEPGAPEGPGIDAMPAAFRLYPNSPNPFNPLTTIAYDLPRESDVRITIYDLSGARVRELVSAHSAAGHHQAVWDGTNTAGNNVASGVYFLRMEASAFSDARKIVLAK